MKTRLIVFAFLLVGALTGCKKDEATPSRTELIAKTWQAESVTGLLGGLTLEAYKKGGTANLLDFSKFQIAMKSDGTATLTNYDGTKITGTWKFTNNENSADINNGAYTMDITELTASTLKFKTKYTITTDDFKALGITKGTQVDATFNMIPL
ncbi:MAG: lipocalin family protein [Spirosomataceae bacterium]